MQVRIPCEAYDFFGAIFSYLFIFPLFVELVQISDFGSAKADFGTDLAISTRTDLNPG